MVVVCHFIESTLAAQRSLPHFVPYLLIHSGWNASWGQGQGVNEAEERGGLAQAGTRMF